MRIAPSLIGLAIAAAALCPPSAAAQKTSYDVRRHSDFSQTKTFAFKKLPAARPDTTGQTITYDGPAVDEQTNIAITTELERRGWKRDDGSPDVYVVTRRTFQKEFKTYTPFWGPYYSPAGWWGPYPYPYYPHAGPGWETWDGGPIYTVEKIRGTLTVDVEDVVTGALMWRGLATKHVYEAPNAATRTKRVNDEVADIFKNFPPSRR